MIETVEGPFALSRCLRQDYDCGSGNCCGDGDCNCVFRGIYGEISEEVKEKLTAVKFSDLVKHGETRNKKAHCAINPTDHRRQNLKSCRLFFYAERVCDPSLWRKTSIQNRKNPALFTKSQRLSPVDVL